MLNLLALKPDGGLEKYMEYGAAVAPLLEGIGGRPLYTGAGSAAPARAGDHGSGTWSSSCRTRAGPRSWRWSARPSTRRSRTCGPRRSPPRSCTRWNSNQRTEPQAANAGAQRRHRVQLRAPVGPVAAGLELLVEVVHVVVVVDLDRVPLRGHVALPHLPAAWRRCRLHLGPRAAARSGRAAPR